MQKLDKNWFIENLVDFEHKKYVLLGYLQHVKQNFVQQKLYPHLADLVMHYRNLKDFVSGKQLLFDSFPERISNVDLENFRLAYEKVVQDDELMKEIETIVQFALPQFKVALDEGKEIYEFIEEHISVTPVGILPLYKNEGYLLVKEAGNDTRVYEYKITLFEEQLSKYRGVHTRFITTYRHSVTSTFEWIKRDLIKANNKLPNPATYAMISEMQFPLRETIEPITQRLLIRYIEQEKRI
ncbi:MAG: hypothetical protein K1X81_03650 [Bacteroidia bacterium]|nr:hypothetical protein [Bacteroidia bacterium]